MKAIIISIITIATAVVIFTLNGAKKQDVEPDKPAPEIKVDLNDVRRLTEAHNNFGFNIYRQLLADSPSKNVFISPTSISTAFGMLFNGTVDQVKTEFENVFEFKGFSDKGFNSANHSLIYNLTSTDKSAVLDIANSIWIRNNFPVKTEFIAQNSTNFDAVIKNAPFNKQTVKDINEWCSEKTRGKINEVLKSLSPDDVMALVNAVYFKGTWKEEFDKASTYSQDFTLADNSKVKVPLMYKESECHYLENDDLQAVRLPFGKGDMAMTFILPKQGLKQFQSELNAASFLALQKQMHKQKIQLYLPRFKVEYEKNFVKTLEALGLKHAFGLSSGFAKINPNSKLAISKVIHKTFLEVKEEGAEAAAVTAIVVKAESAGLDLTPMMKINKPFFCAISNIRTGNIVFMGSIFNPLK